MNGLRSGHGYKKRSAGVTAAATFIILLSVIRLLGTGSINAGFSFLAKSGLILIAAYSILSNIGNIIAATNSYRLKEWARKTLIILTAIQIVYMLFISIPLSNKSIAMLKTAPESRQRLIDGYKAIPEDARIQKNITEEWYMDLVFKKIHSFANIVRVVSIIYLALIIYFFTRPKVKEQFVR